MPVPRKTCGSFFNSDKKFLFLLLARFIAASAASARPEKIQPDLDPLH
jgi:hypothetical protein